MTVGNSAVSVNVHKCRRHSLVWGIDFDRIDHVDAVARRHHCGRRRITTVEVIVKELIVEGLEQADRRWQALRGRAREGAVARPVGRLPEEAQLGVYINAHPRLRTFFFELGNGEDAVDLPRPIDDALARWLDVDLDEA